MTRTIFLLLILLTVSACSWVGGDKTSENLELTRGFLWQRLGGEDYVEFAAAMRCAAGTDGGYTSEQIRLLAEESLTPEEYDFENSRPDWLSEYALSGLDPQVAAATALKCPR